MQIDAETQKRIQELQQIEQNLQVLIMQKQAFQAELGETENAYEEVKKSKDDIYRVLGQVMLKADKKTTESELKEKKELLSLRVKAIEKQENTLRNTLERIKGEVVEKIDTKQ